MLFLQLLIDGILMGCIYALNAAGLSLVFGVVGIVNFAYSDFMMVSMYTCFWMFVLFGLDPLFSIPIAVMLSALLGFLTYKFVIKKVVDAPMLSQTLATYALGMVIRYTCVLFFTNNFRYISDALLDHSLVFGDLIIEAGKLAAALISVCAFIILILILNKTKIGLAMRATSMDRTAASLMGMNSQKVFTITFVIGASCVAIAGSVLMSHYYVYPLVGQNFGNISFAVIALGGFGSVPGALIAGVIIGIVESMAGFLFDSAYKYAIVFLVYILVVIFKPKGLKGW
ncbi:MAG: branched-chain amino acid ABC transporter permease [Lachnospiraceae bacterium]|nr:branched-chain amino acid ABC transporter permease [Lachnospiraceae bacterium]